MPRKNPAAVALAKLRMKRISPERRSEIASIAGTAGMTKLNKTQRRKLARSGGLAGGPARAAVLTAVERREIAKKAAEARWKRTKTKASKKAH